MYELGERDEIEEMRLRYDAMVNTLSSMFNCGTWDIESLFDSKNNIEVADIVKNFVDEIGHLPNWNNIYVDALGVFAEENGLIIGIDVDIFTNYCLDTHIIIREELYDQYANELEQLFDVLVEIM